jgi:hydrogenase/urease accessory protein HupE
MKRISAPLATVGLVAFASSALAHPGHGDPGNDFGLVHYLTEPMHIAVGFGLLIGLLLLTKLVRRSISRIRKRKTSH